MTIKRAVRILDYKILTQCGGERDGRRTTEEARESRRITDSDGVVLTNEQIEYFKNSIVRDENGNLLVVYHGSPSLFTEFEHRFI